MASTVRQLPQPFGPSTVLPAASLILALALRSAVQGPMTAPVAKTPTWLPLACLALATALPVTCRVQTLAMARGLLSGLPALRGSQRIDRLGRFGRSDYRTYFECRGNNTTSEKGPPY